MAEETHEDMELTTAAAIGIGSALVGAGSAWGVTRKTVKTLETKVDAVEARERNVIDRLARIETKLDLALGVTDG